MIPTTDVSDVAPITTPFRLWRNRNFLSLIFGTWLSTIGDGAYFIVLGWFVLNVTGSEFALGTTLTFASVPRIIFLLIGGAVADRVNRKLILVISLLVRAIILLIFVIMLVFLNGKPNIWIIDIVAILFGVVDAFFYSANGSIVPSVVPSSALSKANSLIQTVQQLSALLGPLLAAALLGFQAYRNMFGAIACVFAISAMALSFLQLRHNEERLSSHQPSTSVWHDIWDGAKFVGSVRILLIIMLISLGINLLFMGPINIGIPVLIKSFGWSGGTYATYEAGFGIGTVLGGLIVIAMKGFRNRFLWLGCMGAIMGLAMSGIGFVHVPWEGVALMGVMGITVSVVNIPFFIYIQTIVPANKLGRTMSLLTLMSMGLVPVSYTVSSFILQRHQIDVPELLLGCGIAMAVLFGALYLFRDFRQVESHPLWQVSAKGTETEIGNTTVQGLERR